MRTYLSPLRTVALLAALVLTTGAWACSKTAERKLLEAEDNAAKLIEKAEQVRTDLLNTPQPIGIDQSTATNIDRFLLRLNTNVKRVSAASDRFAANPAVGAGEITAALTEARQTLEEFKASVHDGSLGIKNADSKQSVVAILDSLKSVLSAVETAVSQIQGRKS